VGGANVGAFVDVGVTSIASGVDVGSASIAFGVAVACALSVSCAATVMATAVEIVSVSAPAPPQDVKSRAKSMRMDRKLCFRFLFILFPFGNYRDLPAKYYTAWTLENTHEKRPADDRALRES
jgi:hypothetical protein